MLFEAAVLCCEMAFHRPVDPRVVGHRRRHEVYLGARPCQKRDAKEKTVKVRRQQQQALFSLLAHGLHARRHKCAAQFRYPVVSYEAGLKLVTRFHHEALISPGRPFVPRRIARQQLVPGQALAADMAETQGHRTPIPPGDSVDAATQATQGVGQRQWQLCDEWQKPGKVCPVRHTDQAPKPYTPDPQKLRLHNVYEAIDAKNAATSPGLAMSKQGVVMGSRCAHLRSNTAALDWMRSTTAFGMAPLAGVPDQCSQ